MHGKIRFALTGIALQHTELSKWQIRFPEPVYRCQLYIAHADDFDRILFRRLFQHDAFEIIAVRNLCSVDKNIVPVLHAGLDAGHAYRVRQQPRQPLAGILSGFVGIQTEEHPLHIRAFR